MNRSHNATVLHLFRAKLHLLLLTAFIVTPCLGQTKGKPHVTAMLIAEDYGVVPGRPLSIGLRLEMEPGWHTYWKNPGDAGMATTIELKAPAGFTVGPIRWPYPQLFGEPPEVSYGYDTVVVLPVEIIPPASLTEGDTVIIRAHCTWLACREACVRESVDVELRLPVNPSATGPDPRWSGELRQALATVPQRDSTLVLATRRMSKEYRLRILSMSTPYSGPLTYHFFPAEEGVIDHSAAQTLAFDDGSIRLPASPFESQPVDRLRGVLVVRPEKEIGQPAMSYEVDVQVFGADR